MRDKRVSNSKRVGFALRAGAMEMVAAASCDAKRHDDKTEQNQPGNGKQNERQQRRYSPSKLDVGRHGHAPNPCGLVRFSGTGG
jgi:hypothetical protein